MAKKPTRLRFTEDDLADSQVKKAADRADKAADKAEKAVDKAVDSLSIGLSVIAVLFLSMAKEPYAITVAFLLLFVKGVLLYKQAKEGK